MSGCPSLHLPFHPLHRYNYLSSPVVAVISTVATFRVEPRSLLRASLCRPTSALRFSSPSPRCCQHQQWQSVCTSHSRAKRPPVQSLSSACRVLEVVVVHSPPRGSAPDPRRCPALGRSQSKPARARDSSDHTTPTPLPPQAHSHPRQSPYTLQRTPPWLNSCAHRFSARRLRSPAGAEIPHIAILAQLTPQRYTDLQPVGMGAFGLVWYVRPCDGRRIAY